MQRDMNYIRELLLMIEEKNKPRLNDLLAEDATKDDYDKLAEHLTMLVDEAGFVTGIEAHTYQGKDWLDLRLTWHGHDYLDAVRDPEIWDKTMSGAKEAGGFTIDILKAIAKGYIKKQVKEKTDIEIDL